LIPSYKNPRANSYSIAVRIHTGVPFFAEKPPREGAAFGCAPGERTFYRVKDPNPPGSGKG